MTNINLPSTKFNSYRPLYGIKKTYVLSTFCILQCPSQMTKRVNTPGNKTRVHYSSFNSYRKPYQEDQYFPSCARLCTRCKIHTMENLTLSTQYQQSDIISHLSGYFLHQEAFGNTLFEGMPYAIMCLDVYCCIKVFETRILQLTYSNSNVSKNAVHKAFEAC